MRLSGHENLKLLRLAHNPVKVVLAVGEASLTAMPQLQQLDLSHTHLQSVHGLQILVHLQQLNLSYTPLTTIGLEGFHGLLCLQHLDLSYTLLSFIIPGGLNELVHLQQLNMRGSNLYDFPLDVFQNLTELTEVITPNYRLCCPGIWPKNTLTSACMADKVATSSCEDLLHVKFYQVILFCFSLVAVLGNAACVPIRLAVHKESMDSSFSILVTNLNVANLLMGLYCGIIAGADEVFRGRFVHNEKAWTDSSLCRGAGFLYLLSSEVSTLTITIVTWERVTRLLSSLQGPGFHLQLGKRSSVSVSVAAWIVGATVSVVFLCPSVSPWAMYRRTAICVPLPTEADGRQGMYSVLMHAGLRFLLLLLVSAGQIWLYRRAHSDKSRLTIAHCEALRLARQFRQVAVTNSVCWAVVGCVTLWSLVSRVAVNEEVAAAVAILLHPVNAALNPCLYVMSKVLENRRLQRDARLMQLLKSRMTRGKLTGGIKLSMVHLVQSKDRPDRWPAKYPQAIGHPVTNTQTNERERVFPYNYDDISSINLAKRVFHS
jgi:hypothetical protein